MRHLSALFLLAFTSITFMSVPTYAQDEQRPQNPERTGAANDMPARDRAQIRDRDIYGYQLMTREERDQFRAQMRAAATAEEQNQLRAEHHAKMQERAKSRGMTLPDQPGGGAQPRQDRPRAGSGQPRGRRR